jgi:hypothetical protein
MNTISRFKIFSFFLVVAYILSACGGAPATAVTSGGSDKPLAHPVTYVGVIESINGDQWTINGVTVTVGADIVRDGPFTVGDQVKVEGQVNQDGSVVVTRVETPSPEDLSALPQLGNDNESNSNDENSNDANVNDANVNDANSNDTNSNDASIGNINSNDDNGNAVNSNDDNGGSTNTNDDNSSNDNSSTPSNSNDDHGGNSNGNDSPDDNGNDSNSND